MMNCIVRILKINFIRILLLVTIILVSPICLCSQDYNTSSKKAIKHFEKACQHFYDRDYDAAMINVDKSLQFDEDFLYAILLKADLYLELSGDYLDEYFCYEKVEALLSHYLSIDDYTDEQRKHVEKKLRMVRYRKSSIENPLDYELINIGDINTVADEYINQYYINEDKVVLTRKYKEDFNYTYYEENVYEVVKCDSTWLEPRLLFENLNAIGAANISHEGDEIYFSGCGWDNGCGSCDIYCVKHKDGKFSRPINIRSINTSEWESQPCLSYDGQELYFVRRNKKKGGSDIYVSKRDNDGNWQKAVCLNSSINTSGNEMAPFIHYDGKTLYFSSDTHLGMGGYDLFMSQRAENGEWQEAVNLGYPLNTLGDEINVVVLNDAAKSYMSASRKDGNGGYDIYEFDMVEKFRPQMVEIEKDIVVDYYSDMLEKQESVVLKNIYFNIDSAELDSSSEEGIEEIYNFLQMNPNRSVLIEGHTDDVGNEEYNLKLSERRAETVKAALVEKGISSDRIKTKGCGSSQPLSTNNFDDELKTLNRRVSMSFID